MGWHRIVVGIGNPGTEYEATRHNVGFMVLDLLASRLGLEFTQLERHAEDGSRLFSGKVKARVCESRRKGRSFLLVKPQTYVNLSGEVVAPLLRHAGGQPMLFVIVDDLNLPLGRIRIRPSGSAGGHNGLKSIEAALGHSTYARLRIGVGGGKPDPSYVLGRFTKAEKPVVEKAIADAGEALRSWMDEGIEKCMSKFNRKPPAEDKAEGSPKT